MFCSFNIGGGGRAWNRQGQSYESYEYDSKEWEDEEYCVPDRDICDEGKCCNGKCEKCNPKADPGSPDSCVPARNERELLGLSTSGTFNVCVFFPPVGPITPKGQTGST